MRTLKRNETKFWYCLRTDTNVPTYDGNGNKTGERIPIYTAETEMYANVSPAFGTAQTEQFGNIDRYDKVIVTADTGCPIDENSVLFVDKEPEFKTAFIPDERGIVRKKFVPLYDYIVVRVAKSLNSVSYAIRKVSVS